MKNGRPHWVGDFQWEWCMDPKQGLMKAMCNPKQGFHHEPKGPCGFDGEFESYLFFRRWHRDVYGVLPYT